LTTNHHETVPISFHNSYIDEEAQTLATVYIELKRHNSEQGECPTASASSMIQMHDWCVMLMHGGIKGGCPGPLIALIQTRHDEVMSNLLESSLPTRNNRNIASKSKPMCPAFCTWESCPHITWWCRSVQVSFL